MHWSKILIVRLTGLPLSVAGVGAAFLAGGMWPWIAVAGLLFVGMGTERLIGDDSSESGQGGLGRVSDFPVYASAALLIATTFAFAVFVANPHPETANEAKTGLALLGGVLAQAICVATAGSVVAHELIHRLNRPVALLLGEVLSAILFDPADPVEHVWQHHCTVGLRHDPTTARRGESYWAFLRRSIPETVRFAWRHEQDRLRGKQGVSWLVLHRVARPVIFILLFAVLFTAVAGKTGLIVFVTTGVLARLTGEVIKYMAHYGLVRAEGHDLATRHSWNARQSSNAVVLLNSIWHSEHHVRADLPYWRLERPTDVPMVPYSTGLMALAAFVPPIWFAIMRAPLEEWDAHFAEPAERDLLEASAS